MFGSFGWMELLLILFIVLIIFGAGKIPQLGEGLGKAIKGFKKSIHEPDVSESTDPNVGPSELPQQDSQVSHSSMDDQNNLSAQTKAKQASIHVTEPVEKS